ncbi:MAG TPA: hypothetical protein P5081_00785 [Phycisphaerae bacterium]|nr:hypothetical protein [Phycisphaerae bacterium]HRW51387.1 hypothetical protein [Phycisphaerae bacterium]
MMIGIGWRRILCLAGFVVVGAAGAGCSSPLVGTWNADPIPQDMDFYIVSAEFKDNGDFRAIAREAGGETRNLRGKYEFDGFKLKLMRPGSPSREYPTTYYMTGVLEVKSEGGSQRLKKQ